MACAVRQLGYAKANNPLLLGLKNNMNIAKSSPLYEYWNSEQGDEEEKIRLLMLNEEEPASILFKNEPYKWENLYQSSLRGIVGGNESSIRGLMILLSTITSIEKEKVLNNLEYLLDSRIIYKLRNEKYNEITSRKNIFTTFKILMKIFINPYQLEIKHNKVHIYEKTGMFFYRIRKFVFFDK